jgi:transposase
VAQARACPDEVVAVYGDEYTLERQPKLGPTWASPGPEPLARLVAGINFTYRYAGALDVGSGRVVWDKAMVMGVSNLRTFLRKLRRAYPTKTLFLIWDNWPVHQHPKILELASELEIQILWLPTYAPWTNPIEKLWRWLIEDVLRHHRLADHWDELKRQVATFLDQFAEGSVDLLRYVGLLPD